jgi:hypothetical protein
MLNTTDYKSSQIPVLQDVNLWGSIVSIAPEINVSESNVNPPEIPNCDFLELPLANLPQLWENRSSESPFRGTSEASEESIVSGMLENRTSETLGTILSQELDEGEYPRHVIHGSSGSYRVVNDFIGELSTKLAVIEGTCKRYVLILLCKLQPE